MAVEFGPTPAKPPADAAMVKVVLTMPAADATQLIEDWTEFPNVGLLTPVYEHDVRVAQIERVEGGDA